MRCLSGELMGNDERLDAEKHSRLDVAFLLNRRCVVCSRSLTPFSLPSPAAIETNGGPSSWNGRCHCTRDGKWDWSACVRRKEKIRMRLMVSLISFIKSIYFNINFEWAAARPKTNDFNSVLLICFTLLDATKRLFKTRINKRNKNFS